MSMDPIPPRDMPNLFSFTAGGPVGSTIFSRNATGGFNYELEPRPPPHSELQDQKETAVSTLNWSWHHALESTREAWDRAAIRRFLGGYHYFFHVNIMRAAIGLDTIWSPP